MQLQQGRTEDIPQAISQVEGRSYDDIYIESWQAVLAECDTKLEPEDRERAVSVKNIDEFRAELDILRSMHRGEADAAHQVIRLLYPTLDHYEQFTQAFVDMMLKKVDTSRLWGLLCLVIELSLKSTGTIERITRMLEQIGHKLRRMNECSSSFTDINRIKDDTVKINRELITLWLDIITFFRNQSSGLGFQKREPGLRSLSEICDDAMQSIGDAVDRVEKAAEHLERRVRRLDREIFQKMISLDIAKEEAVQLPCCVLPVARNRRFFGREELLAEIDGYLQPEQSSTGLKSMAIHGLGGIGKTQIALEYAYSKREVLDAVLWVPADNPLALQQGFTKIAVDGLQMPDANPASHQENMLMVISWLQRTTAKWLLIFDNVESHRIFENCWPAVDRGAILITTRRHMVASQPIERGLPILQFPEKGGAQLILHLLDRGDVSAEEETAARELSGLLNGHALAISQMAAYMKARTLPISKFLGLYKAYPERMRKERKEGWKYIGYNHAIDTVWDISLGALEPPAASLLRVLSFCAPDSIPANLLEARPGLSLPPAIEICSDELSRWDTIEQLTDHALVRHDTGSDKLSLHRLVQAECLYRSSGPERQEGFDGAVKLLLEKFPSRGNLVNMDSLWEESAQYLEHIASLAKNWKESQKETEPLSPTVDFCNLMADCAWFVHDNDSAGILSLVIDNGDAAYHKLPADQRSPRLEADILILLCIRDLRAEGDFKSAEKRGRESLAIRERLDEQRDLGVTNCYNYIAIACDSMGRHDEARTWLEKSRAILEGRDDEPHLRLLCQNNLNFSRNMFSVGNFEKSEEMLNQACSQAKSFESWYSLAFAHQTKADLYLRWGRPDSARREVSLARSTLTKSGGFASISWTSEIVSYRTSSVAMMQGIQEEAIDEAKKADVIGRLYNMAAGARARVSHLLMKAYLMGPEKHEREAEEARQEAQRLRRLLPRGRTDLGDESDEAFDMLVDISVR